VKGLVIGRGVSGRAAGELLKKLGIEVEFYEDGGEEPSADFDFAVKSPGVPPYHELVLKLKKGGVPLYGEVELAKRFSRGITVGITGTNGKSTTTAMVYYALKELGYEAFVGGNYGIPASSFALETGEESISVLELSSFQLEDLTSFRGEVGALLNVTPDHLNRYGSFEEYKRAKLKLLDHFDFVLLNGDDPLLSKVRRPGVLFFGRSGGEFFVREKTIVSSTGLRIPLEELPLKGVHNEENYLCAVGILSLLGLTEEEVVRGLKAFKGLPHRTEPVATVNGVLFVNDSKATNPDSTEKAVLSFEKVVLIAGGSNKGLTFDHLIPLFKERVKALVAIGETSELLKETFSEVVPVEVAENLEEAVFKAYSLADRSTPVLLSPGCASFDMFSSFEERGEAFKKAVRKLAEET